MAILVNENTKAICQTNFLADGVFVGEATTSTFKQTWFRTTRHA